MSYEDDYRVVAGNKNSWFTTLNEKTMQATVKCEDEDGEIHEVIVKVCYEVCPTCHGKGKHVNPSIDCNGLSSEDFYEDPDFRDEYFGGMYDVTCFECHGKNVVPCLDRNNNDPSVIKMIDDKLEQDYQYARELAHERKYGY